MFRSRESKRSPATELELLHDVVLSFGQRDRVVEAKGPKGRLPNQAHTYRSPDDIGVVKLHGAGRTGRRIHFPGRGPGRGALIVPKRPRIGIDSALKADLLGQEPERHLQFRRPAPIFGAPQRVARSGIGVEGKIARTYSVRSKATNKIGTHLELVKHSKLTIADAIEHAALDVDQSDDIGNQRRVVFSVDRGFQVADVASNTGKVLLEVDEQTVRRILVVIECVVVQRIAYRRSPCRAVCQFLPNWQ